MDETDYCWVHRENGTVDMVAYQGPIVGVCEEQLAVFDPHVQEYVNRPPPVPTISRRQFFQQAAIAGIITESEALAAVTTGALPSSILAFINTLPADQQFGAKMLFSVSEFVRSSPLANAFGTAIGMAPEQVDDFFTAASQL